MEFQWKSKDGTLELKENRPFALDGKITVPLDRQTDTDQSPTSAYATLNRQPEEYLAESMTVYLESDESREKLKENDPSIHDYCERWNLAP